MKLSLSRSPTLLSTALLLLISSTCPALTAAQVAQTQDEAKQIAELDTVLRTGSNDEKLRAVTKLSKITSEKASELLLKTLKNNLENKRGFYIKYGAASIPNGTLWTAIPSENNLLVEALGNRKYEKALPTLRKMLKMKEKWLGLSLETVAENIYRISAQPLKYDVEGDANIYPEQERPADTVIDSVLFLPAAGEKAWEANSLNMRLREAVSNLEGPGGPVGFRDPYYRTLREETGHSALIDLVKNGDVLVRPYAVEALGILGENLDQTIPVLVAAVRDKDPRMRFRSTRALGLLLGLKLKPEEGAIVVSALKNALSDAEPEVRLSAAEQFARYGTGTFANTAERQEIVRLLVALLDEKFDYLRWQAASALARLGPMTAEVVAPLIHLLKSPIAGDRERAAGALFGILNNSEPSEEVKPIVKDICGALFTAVNDPADAVRYELADGLGEVGRVVPGVIPVLIKLTKDRSPSVRSQAAQSLGRFEMDRARIVPALARMLSVEDEDGEVIESALRSLQEIGPEARSAAHEVRKLLQSKDPRVREYAGYALEKIDVPLARQKSGEP